MARQVRHLCDVNVWLALTLSGHFHASAARSWFESLTAPDSAAFCRSTHQSFLRLLTTPAMLEEYRSAARSNEEAWSAYESLRSEPRVGWLEEPDGLEPHWRRYSIRPTASPKLWMDSYLAAFVARLIAAS